MPILFINKRNVKKGTENEEIIHEFEVRKICVFGEDVSGEKTWKSRASNTKIRFYKNPSNGKIRMICREQDTQKLRLNHYVPVVSIDNNKKNMYIWAQVDQTVNNENNDNENTKTLFGVKFNEEEQLNKFKNIFEECVQINKEIYDN